MRAALMLICLTLFAGAVQAEKIYRWTGSDGKAYYGDLPPQGARDIREFDRKVGTTAAATAEGDAESRPQQVAASDADCAAKRAQLSTFKNAARLVEKDSLGREREYTAAERDLLVARTQADLESQCGDAPADE
jgi:hypothetical protein